MGPPRDRLAAMQQAAYFEEGDDYGVQMQEQMDGNFINIAFWMNIFLNVIDFIKMNTITTMNMYLIQVQCKSSSKK